MTAAKHLDKIRGLISAYRNRIAEIPISVPADVPIEHTIELRDNTPVSTQPRRIPYSQREEIQKKIDELIENDFVEPSRSPYGAGVIPVLKRDGTLRICVDYRALNAKTIPRPFPIPRCDDLLEKIGGAKFFSVIDLKNGYFHIPIKEQDRYKTAFVLPWTKLQWKRLPQGLIGAPFTFAEVIVFVFQDLDAFVIAYFDDILIFSKDEESHVKHVEIVLDRLIKHNLRINE